MKGKRLVNARPERRQEHQPARWIYGVNAVRRRLEVQPDTVFEVHLLPRASGRLADIRCLAGERRIATHHTDAATLQRLAGSTAHQGVAARTAAFRYVGLERVVEAQPPVILVLDQLQDPQNLGALIRTAAAAGVAGVVIPRHGAVGVTPVVEKVAAGTVNDIGVCQVPNLAQALRWLRGRGFWSVGLVPAAGPSLFATDLPRPVALVLGGEGGMRPLVKSLCDVVVSIPMQAAVESLNASAAGAVAMYELRRRGLLDTN